MHVEWQQVRYQFNYIVLGWGISVDESLELADEASKCPCFMVTPF